jgi:uncharacterized membrane protein
VSQRHVPIRGYWPLATPFVIGLFIVAIVVAVLVGLNLVAFVYHRIGLSRGWIIAILFGSILGSWLNIPVHRFPDRVEVFDTEVVFFGMRYRIPTLAHTGTTILAVNLGGAIIPTALASYLIVHDHLWPRAMIAVAGVAVVVRLVARPVPGVGIVAPTIAPPVAAGIIALAVATHTAAALAYVAGTIGTLVGADLLNLHRIRDLGAPVASIGGAGTFDGIFVTGILAVVIAAL